MLEAGAFWGLMRHGPSVGEFLGASVMDTPVVLRAGLIDLDATYFVQLALFLLLYAVLRTVFFGPYTQFLRKRDEATEGLRRRARELQEQIRALEADIEGRLAAARAEALQVRRRLAEEGGRLRSEIVARERARMQAELERHIAAIEEEKRRFLERADEVADSLASLIEAQARAVERGGP